ncbi:methanogenesis marker protein 3 [Methanocaldococcus infernus ME]|uniref:UPF0288 protein Metin_0123 n=1 Tax=Methanocaldococcus infernus (strain DSM 11812 / JCM 15783 / ME) TaxID=573063 RepID=D5VQE2_METIM|nr:methanogenesis marker 3 protein [Methanocaldococcus infernus]ADG12795.1 methanogenesis marker protein 3 [Methanocaldococcus infernus ME]
MAEVIVNDKVKRGETLKDVLDGEFYKEGANIVIIKGIKKEAEATRKFLVKTNKGNITIAVTEDNEASNFFLKNYKKFVKRVRWISHFDIAFGPTRIDLEVSDKEKVFNKWDVLLSLSGLDKDEGHLVFITKKTSGIYGLEEPKIGRVVGGKWVLSNLGLKDYIIDIELISEEKELVDYIVTTDLNTKLEDGWKIITYFEAEFFEVPSATEHCLAIMENHEFKIDEYTNTFIANASLKGLKIEEGNLVDRDRGVITVRNFGDGEGKVFIYKESRSSSLSHTVVGKVRKGMELIDFSETGTLTVKTVPERLCAIGLEVEKAIEMFEKHGIEVEVEGKGIVVEQEPEYTLNVLKEKKVKLKAISKENIITITLYDDKAPITSWYFRRTTGLTTKRVGKLHVYFKHKDIVMFKGNPDYAKGLLPENTPENVVKGLEIGVSNMVSRYKGMIGVRLSDHDKFGPTGESFEKTNIVGRVLENWEFLKKVRTGEDIYILLKK